MSYKYQIKWTQSYTGWQDCRLQNLEKQLACSDLTEAKTVLAKVMSL